MFDYQQYFLFQSHPPLLERLAALKGDEKKTK